MTELILHHFAPSPFAEKVRLTFGFKALNWSSVDIPMVMPKPDLMPLTGGYRRTPVLQIGADIYADSRLIMLELERRFPEPTLFPGVGRGLMQALSSWSDSTFFEPGAALSMGLNEGLPEDLLNDRKEFFSFMNFDTLKASLPHLYAQFLSQMRVLEQELNDGRDYLTGDKVSGVDILAYFPVWMARGNFAQIDDWMSTFPHLLRWEKRMQKVGHGISKAISAKQALAVAKNAEPELGGVVSENPEGLVREQKVTVAPSDYGAVPVSGMLDCLDFERISIQRTVEGLGTINNHFPRSGFVVSATE